VTSRWRGAASHTWSSIWLCIPSLTDQIGGDPAEALITSEPDSPSEVSRTTYRATCPTLRPTCPSYESTGCPPRLGSFVLSLHAEREVQSRKSGVIDSEPRGLGVADYREFGLQWLGAGEVRAWAEERFTAGNAAVWISGAVPPNLRLNLRPGKRFPRPKVAPLQHATPAFYQRGRSGVALSMLWDAGITAKYVVSGLLDDRIRNRLRRVESVAYETRVDHDPGSLTVFADALAENAGRAAASLVEVIRDLADHGHRPEELERVLASNRAARAEPGAILESLTDAAALELGIAVGTISWDDYDREAAALTAEDVAAVTDNALSTALLAIPEGVSCAIDGFTQLPSSNGLSFEGHRFRPAKRANRAVVMSYSDEGISVGVPDGTKHGIRWHDVAAALWWRDGTRHLIALDGSSAHFAPDEWEKPEALLEAIRVNVPADRWVPMDDQAPSTDTDEASV